MKKIFSLLLLGMAITFFTACSGARIANSAQNQTSDKKFVSAKAYCDDGELNQRLQESINKQLQIRKIALGDDLRLGCAFLDYNEGNRALRYLIGFGVGRATSKAVVKLYDQTNEKVGEFEVDAHMSMGIFGGSSDSMINDAAAQITEHLRKKYIVKN